MMAANSKRSATSASFKPGQSGNPSGRPKRTAEEKAREFELIQACKAKTPEALGTIVRLMNTADKDAVRLQAAAFIIERGYGKSVEKKEVLHGLLDDMATAELLEMKRQVQRLRLTDKRSGYP
jgi:Family of unknown function (DUF5681)